MNAPQTLSEIQAQLEREQLLRDLRYVLGRELTADETIRFAKVATGADRSAA